MPRYPIVFLDADNTLFDFTRSQYLSLEKTLLDFGLPFSPALAELYDKINTQVWREYESGLLTRDALCRKRFVQLLSFLHADPAKADPVNDYYEKLLETSSILLPGAEDFCRRLSRDCRLYILTNGAADVQESRMRLSPIQPYIARMFISQSLGVQKPTPEYFQKVFDALSLTKEMRKNAVMMGDSLHSDILGGLNAGLDTIWFNPEGQVIEAGIQPLYTCRTYAQAEALILGETQESAPLS